MREMKDSGVPWIGEIPKGWSLRRIGQMYKERRIKVSDKDFEPLSVTMKGVVPQLSTAAKTDAHDDRKLVRKGDFAINSRSDRRGSCGIAPQDGSVSLINTILCPLSETNSAYLNWLFHSTLFADEFYRWGHGIVDDLWTTNWSDMKRIYIPYPPLLEQQRIASFLDAQCAEIESILENTRASIEDYKALKLSTITDAVTKGVRGDRLMKESGVKWIGEIPAEWEAKAIKYSFHVVSGATPNTNIPEYWDGDLPWITPADYKTEDHYVSLGKRNLTKEGLDSCSAIMVPRGSIIFSKRAPIGTVAISNTNLCTNQGCLACIPFKANSEYFYFAFAAFKEFFELFGSGTTFKEISITSFVNFRMPFPPIDEQQEIAAYLDEKCSAIDALIASKEALIFELEAYKKSIIYEYVTGKKEVI